MTYRTAKLPLNIISERLRWWRAQTNVESLEAYVNDCNAWLIIRFKRKPETAAQRNERLIQSLPQSSFKLPNSVKE